MTIPQRHDCQQELHKADLKVTPARLGVLAALENTDTPLDVTEITDYLKHHSIQADKVTVFRIMNSLTKKGLIIPIQLNESKLRYEHAAKADHHHFVCEQCGSIEDISDCNINQLEKEIQRKKELIVKRHSLEFFGICKNCQN